MKYLFTLFLCVIVSLLVSVGASRAFVFGHDPRGRNLAQWFLFEMSRTEALKQRAALMKRLWEIKASAIDEFIAGRATVHEVIEQFREAEELVEDDNEGVVSPYHRPHTKEQLRRQLVGWVEDELSHDPEQAQKVVRRLKEELAHEPSPVPILR
jgi:hypothetical protein